MSLGGMQTPPPKDGAGAWSAFPDDRRYVVGEGSFMRLAFASAGRRQTRRRSFGDMSQCFRSLPMCGQVRQAVRKVCCSCCRRQWQWLPSRVLLAFTESENVQATWKLKPTERANAASAGLFSSSNRLRAVSQPSKQRVTAMRLPLPSASPDTSRIIGNSGVGGLH